MFVDKSRTNTNSACKSSIYVSRCGKFPIISLRPTKRWIKEIVSSWSEEELIEASLILDKYSAEYNLRRISEEG